MRVIRFTQHLLSYSQNHPLPFSLWVQQYDEGGDDLWWRDEALSVSHDRLLAWLQRWEAVTLDEPDDDWLIEMTNPFEMHILLLEAKVRHH